MRVLCVVGHARSGSTILGNVLNEVPGVAHAGEVARMPFRMSHRLDSRCGCGTELRDCPVWTTIRVGDGFRNLLGDFAHTYAQVTGGDSIEWVIDTSKMSGHLRDLRKEVPAADLRVLHLVRDPRASIQSMMRSRKRKNDRDGKPQTPIADLARYARYANGWRSEVRVIESLRPDLIVRYEDFAANPAGAVAAICRLMEVDSPPVVSDAHVVELGVNHVGMGNLNRTQHGSVEIRIDDRWERDMARLPRAIVWSITRAAARPYGYR